MKYSYTHDSVTDFIAEDSFTGPDRRRRAKEYNGEERRIKQPMIQSEVDELMEGNDA